MAKYHKITGNESVGTIAGMYGVTPQTLLAANPGVSTLSAGAYLRVPSNGLGANTSAGGIKPLATPAAYNPVKAALKVERGTYGQIVGQTNTQTQTRDPYPLYTKKETFASYAPEGQPNTYQANAYEPIQKGNLNAQQIAELNLANARNTFKPSSAFNNWYDQARNGNLVAVPQSVFQELTTLTMNSGVPRDTAILAANSILTAQGYMYNPISKGYVKRPDNAAGSVVDSNGNVVKDIAGNVVTTDGGKFSADSWENYKQKTIARGGKRTWIGRGRNGGGEATAAVVQEAAVGSNTPNSTGSNDSIWRIG